MNSVGRVARVLTPDGRERVPLEGLPGFLAELSGSGRPNRVMKQLTVVATMFMPLSFIVGLFGTNFTRMPFDSVVWFLLMFALMFVSVVGFLMYTWRKT